MRSYNVAAFVDRQPVGASHLITLCAVCVVLFVDGFDIFMVGKIAPAIAHGLGVAPVAMSTVFVLQQIGLAAGAFLLPPLADQFGRKPVLTLVVAGFGLLTILAAFTATIMHLALARGLATVFLSAGMPIALALLAETTPKRRRGLFIGIALGFYAAGNVASGVTAWLVPAQGWQSAFWLGGLLALACLPLLVWLIPESLNFLAARNPEDARIARAIQAISPGEPLRGDERFTSGIESGSGGRLLDIFRDGRARITIILWLACILSMMNFAMTASWLPTFYAQMAGIPIERFAGPGMLGQLGAIVGTVGVGWLMHRWRPSLLLAVSGIVLAASFMILGFLPFGGAPFVMVLFVAMMFQSGIQSGLTILMAISYPALIRSTGIGWAGGAGKLGAVFAPLLGGWALASQFSLQASLALLAVMPFAFALLIALFPRPCVADAPAEAR